MHFNAIRHNNMAEKTADSLFTQSNIKFGVTDIRDEIEK